jgi:ABC-type multidrug transport system fused ATPase/permease subunit
MGKSVYDLQKGLWQCLSSRRKIQLLIVLVLMIAASLSEVLSIGLVVPFLGGLTDPERLYEISALKGVWVSLGASNSRDLTFLLTLLFCLGALIAGAMRLALLWVNTRLSYAIGGDFSIEIYRRTLYQPYSVHVSRNSSDIISGVVTKTGLVIFVISADLTLISSATILIIMLSAIIAINPLITFIVFGIFSCIYLSITILSKRRLKMDGKVIATESTFLVKSMQEGLGGIRDVIIDGAQEVYCKLYREADLRLRRAQGNTVISGHSPRYLVEALGILLISIVAYQVSVESKQAFASIIPVLGALALGAQRLLPVMQQAYSSWTAIQSNRAATEDVIDLLGQSYGVSLSSNAPLEFKQSIKFCNVSFRYGPDEPWILRNVSMEIMKGQFIGIKGETGSGKSTLIDILMGLLLPTEGYLEIDGVKMDEGNTRLWQKNIAHVPQNIYLADCSILENIAFGVPNDQIDILRVKNAAQRAQIDKVIDSFQGGYRTIVGERGAKMSGGQLQRIGVARALYKNVDFLVLDEATSALDDQTEANLMRDLLSSSPGATIVMIAHRSNALIGAQKIIEVKNGLIRF